MCVVSILPHMHIHIIGVAGSSKDACDFFFCLFGHVSRAALYIGTPIVLMCMCGNMDSMRTTDRKGHV